jgi:hypothetical protein
MAPQLGLARVAEIKIAASRVNPTCGDKPGHDGVDGLDTLDLNQCGCAGLVQNLIALSRAGFENNAE